MIVLYLVRCTHHQISAATATDPVENLFIFILQRWNPIHSSAQASQRRRWYWRWRWLRHHHHRRRLALSQSNRVQWRRLWCDPWGRGNKGRRVLRCARQRCRERGRGRAQQQWIFHRKQALVLAVAATAIVIIIVRVAVQRQASLRTRGAAGKMKRHGISYTLVGHKKKKCSGQRSLLPVSQ